MFRVSVGFVFFVGYVWEIFKCVFVIVFDFVGVEVEVVGGIFV